jgi:hypothetical protein
MSMQDGRTILETLIQSSTVDLFHASGIAVAPLPESRLRSDQLPCHELRAVISFSARGFSGSLGLLVPAAVFALVRQPPTRTFGGEEWVRESANQLLGRIKARLLQFQVTLQLGLPQLLTPAALEKLGAQGLLGVYAFRTLRGEVIVTLSGKIDYSVLRYAGKCQIASEGDIIVF